MAIKLGGRGGAEINEYRFFADRGNLWTGDNGFVWLKKGARTFDSTTYPDAYAAGNAVSKTADYQAAAASGGSSPGGLGVSSDGAWAVNFTTSYNGTWYQTDIASDTVNAPNQNWPGTGGGWIMGTGYVKCNGSNPQSSIANANDYFAVALVTFSGSNLVLYAASLVGGSGTDAGKPSSNANSFSLKDSGGTLLSASPYTYTTPGQPACIHWDPVNRRLYVMMAYSYNRCHLFVYYWNSSTFGHTGFSVSSNQDRANVVIDWQSQSSSGSDAAYQIDSMSGDSTHLYVGYYTLAINADGARDVKIRKIPLSGNLSWSSGTTLTGTVSTGGSNKSILVQNSNGTFSVEGLEEGPRYYKTVNSVPKFLGHGNGTNALREYAVNIPTIGEPTPDSRAAATQYQRIK
jgi:hypothetical protein